MSRVLKEEGPYLLEENTNYPEGKGNVFLMREREERIECVGGVDYCRTRKEWVASISTLYDEENDSDSAAIFSGSRQNAIEELWCHRFDAV